MKNLRILIVGGTWTTERICENYEYGKPSSLVFKIAEHLATKYACSVHNGGQYKTLEVLLEEASKFDIVFWWANVDNSLPKIRDVKECAPHVMLVTSKRDDNNTYSFQELVQRTLAAKANLTFKFQKTESGIFEMLVFDPLGCEWYNGDNLNEAIDAAMERLVYLHSITRQKTIPAPEDKGLVLKWYFDQFKQPEYQSDKTVTIPNEQLFIDIVRKYAHKFQEFMPSDCKTTRFIGNASLRPKAPQVGRCGKGMPSFRHDGYIFVSKRNIDKQFIELDNFVPVYLEDDKLFYCGEDKPSVDTPVQIRLYQALPNINYILHSHCYIKGAPYTNTAIPCGAIEECDEVLECLKANYADLNQDYYVLNLKGHGSLLMFNNTDPQFNIIIEPTLEYIPRILPELM